MSHSGFAREFPSEETGPGANPRPRSQDRASPMGQTTETVPLATPDLSRYGQTSGWVVAPPVRLSGCLVVGVLSSLEGDRMPQLLRWRKDVAPGPMVYYGRRRDAIARTIEGTVLGYHGLRCPAAMFADLDDRVIPPVA